MTDSETKSLISDMYRDFSSDWSRYLEEADLDLEMHLGAHFTQEQYEQAAKTGRTLYPFNKTARQVDLISGYEIRNRHILKIGPVGKKDDKACQQHTSIVMQQMNNGGYDMLSEAFKWGSLVTGSNLFELYRDREGVIRFARRPHNSFLLDSSFTLPDLSNCRNILCGQWLHEDEIKLLLPLEADKIDNIPVVHNLGRWQKRISLREKVRLYEEWWRLETGFESYVISRLTGQEIPFKQFAKHPQIGGVSNANDIIGNMKMPTGMPLWSKYQKPTKKVKLNCFVDGEMVWEGDNPTGLDEYNFIWLGGEWAPECDNDALKLRSLTRRLRQIQYARDKRLNQAIDIIESAIMSGKVTREGAILNRDDLYKTGQGKVITVKKEFQGTLLDAIQTIQGTDVPPGVFNLIEIMDKEETETTGLNDEIFGSDDKDIPGVLARFRTGQALTGQQGIFQGFRRAKWQCGIKMVKMNQAMNPQQVARMVEEMPVQGFYVPDFTKFDCTPTEGIMTDSQRHLWYMELVELYKMFPQIISASMIIEAAPIQHPQEVIDKIRQQEQMQQQMMQAQLQTKQAMDSMINAQAAVDIARSKSEIVGQGLDRVKTMVEMQKIAAEPRLQLLDRYITILQMMQDSMNQQRSLPSGQ